MKYKLELKSFKAESDSEFLNGKNCLAEFYVSYYKDDSWVRLCETIQFNGRNSNGIASKVIQKYFNREETTFELDVRSIEKEKDNKSLRSTEDDS